MTTIDLGTPPAPAVSLLDGLPRRVGLTVAELRHCADLAGGAPLPFEEPQRSGSADAFESRLGQSRGASDAEAHRRAVDSLHDAGESLARRGLLTGGVLDPALAGALGLLATAQLALEVDLSVGGAQAKAWHRVAAGAVATLATADGVVFELAWFPVARWADELTRIAALPHEAPLGDSQVPARLHAPYELVDAVGEAELAHRGDLVPVLVAQHTGAVQVGDQTASDAEAVEALTALHRESRGRLRVLAGAVTDAGRAPVGVVSWVLVGDGWRSLTTTPDADGARLGVSRVHPADLATELAPVISEVTA